MFGPGRNWQSAKASLNSSAVIQRFSSISTRRAHGRTPPKPCSDIQTKAGNSSDSDGTAARAGESADIAQDYLRGPIRASRVRAAVTLRSRPAAAAGRVQVPVAGALFSSTLIAYIGRVGASRLWR